MALGVIAVLALVATSLALAKGGHGRAKSGKGSISAKLNGYQETPSLNSTGRGSFKAKLDEDVITFKLEWADLSGPPLFAHVHIAQRGVPGGVSFFLCGGGSKPACPQVTSGTVNGTVGPADIIGPTAQGFAPGDLDSVLAAIRAGVSYANVHTTKFPAGEIRGQLGGGH